MDILPQLLVNSLITGSIYALAASGLCLTFALLKVLNFAHGHMMMLGAYMFLFFALDQQVSLPAAGALAAISMVFVGTLTLTFFVNPFVQFSPLLPFVTTLALASILESIVSIAFGVNVRSLSTGEELSSYEFAGIFITPIQILIIVSALVILVSMALIIHRTGLGRRIRALSENSNASQTLGIQARRINFWVFVVGTVLAAYAGVLVGYETNLQPTMGNAYTIKAFAAMILGGLGSIWGTVIGAYILGFVENMAIGLDFGGYSLPAGYKDAFAFLIILLVLLIRPQGLFGSRARSA
ncbi:MAG: branched-chain amino acid ABC transporter permease [Pseudomonadota bacterium]|jgi:branched-chain amino acid transport system permease protein